MTNFPIDKCPMCEKELITKEMFGLLVYECPTENNINFLLDSKGHYKVSINRELPLNSIQYMYVFPYSIDTSLIINNKSRIYKWSPQPTEDKPNQGWWDFIIEVAQIKADEPEKLLNRLQTLLTYL